MFIVMNHVFKKCSRIIRCYTGCMLVRVAVCLPVCMRMRMSVYIFFCAVFMSVIHIVLSSKCMSIRFIYCTCFYGFILKSCSANIIQHPERLCLGCCFAACLFCGVLGVEIPKKFCVLGTKRDTFVSYIIASIINSIAFNLLCSVQRYPSFFSYPIYV